MCSKSMENLIWTIYIMCLRMKVYFILFFTRGRELIFNSVLFCLTLFFISFFLCSIFRIDQIQRSGAKDSRMCYSFLFEIEKCLLLIPMSFVLHNSWVGFLNVCSIFYLFLLLFLYFCFWCHLLAATREQAFLHWMKRFLQISNFLFTSFYDPWKEL